MTDQTPDVQRWTAKRKTAVVLEVLKGQTARVDAGRKYGSQQSDLQEWTERFLATVEQGLKLNTPDEFAEYETKIKDLAGQGRGAGLDRDIPKETAEIQSREMKS